ncbi:ATP-dependent zinc protease [Candidatus Woesearchaeota archaeon]|nr:ATP-dependent zinc protease [Candidatus Woesearchaeota archaeon]
MEQSEKAKNKTYIGLYEKVTLMGNNTPNKEVIAKIDTGATRSSIDVKLAAGLKLGPVLTSRMIKSAQGSTLRPIVEGEIIIAGKQLKVHFTIANRSKMKYSMLIGQDVLKEGEFLIDPSKILN